MTYTPEPWKAHDEETHWAIYANGNHLVARIPIRKSSWESDKDNALLIESAPALRAQNRTLLEALEAVISALSLDDTGFIYDEEANAAFALARAAIASVEAS